MTPFEYERVELQKLLISLLPNEGNYATPVSGVGIHRFDSNSTPRPHIYQPMLVIIAQGQKWMRIGKHEYVYGERDCFVSGLNMPIASCLIGASREKPYLALSMNLNRSTIISLRSELCLKAGAKWINTGALVQNLSPDLLQAGLRLVKLLNRASFLPIVADMIMRELHLYLLLGPFGASLLSIYSADTKYGQIEKTIVWLKNNYRSPLKIAYLAEMANMAVSTFHKNFKEATTVSPLQYQKRLRLEEAQRLMLRENYDVTHAAFAVGYESQTQFSREYKKYFGESPQKDIAKLRKRFIAACTWQPF